MLKDGYANLITGSGVPGCDKGLGGYYASRRTPEQNWTAYEESWCARRIVDIKVGDTLREWRTWADDQQAAQDLEDSLNIRKLLKKALSAARITGGAALYIGQQNISPEQLGEPLDVESLGPKDVSYFLPFDRTELSVVDYDENPLSERWRHGETYSVNRAGASADPIHWTRFVWFDGADVSPRTREAQQGWGDSIYNGIEALMEAADSAIVELRSLIPEAKVDVFGVEGLAELLETKEDEKRFLKRWRIAAKLKSTQQALVIDKEDTYEQKTLTFSGITDAAKAVLQTLSGAVDIPITRFLGVSPGGLNATGEGDLRNYYDGLAAYQKGGLKQELYKLDKILLQLAGIQKEPDYEWNSLWQLTEAEIATLGKEQAETLNSLSGSMLFDPLFLSMLGKHMMMESLAFSGVEQAIEEYGEDDLQFEADEPEGDTEPDGSNNTKPAEGDT